MDFEKRSDLDGKYFTPENRGKDQDQRIKELVNIVKNCEELLVVCKDVLKYTPASSIMSKRIDEMLKDISLMNL